jgi:hypothetical protein
MADARDRDRHLFDAAALLTCIEDPLAERDALAGSDPRRLAVLKGALPPGHEAWRRLPEAFRAEAEAAPGILSA